MLSVTNIGAAALSMRLLLLLFFQQGWWRLDWTSSTLLRMEDCAHTSRRGVVTLLLRRLLEPRDDRHGRS